MCSAQWWKVASFIVEQDVFRSHGMSYPSVDYRVWRESISCVVVQFWYLLCHLSCFIIWSQSWRGYLFRMCPSEATAVPAGQVSIWNKLAFCFFSMVKFQVACLLCRGFISVAEGDRARFVKLTKTLGCLQLLTFTCVALLTLNIVVNYQVCCINVINSVYVTVVVFILW